MYIMKILKRALLFLVTLTVIATVSSTVAFAEKYTSGDFWDDVKGLASSDNEITFTTYEGQLATLSEDDGYDSSLTQYSDLKEFVLQVVNFALGFLGLLAVLIVIYGGVLYLTAGGNEENSTTGKKAIMYAGIGLLIVMGSFAFVNTIISSVVGEDGLGAEGQQGQAIGGSFNAYSQTVERSAQNIYSGFVFLADSIEELKQIYEDANKDSLQIKTGVLPSKASVSSFLYTTRDRLQNIRSSFDRFSSAEAMINEKISDLEQLIDKVQNSQPLEIKGTGVNIAIECDRDTDDNCLNHPAGDFILNEWSDPSGGQLSLFKDEGNSFYSDISGRLIDYYIGTKDEWNSIGQLLVSKDPTAKYIESTGIMITNLEVIVNTFTEVETYEAVKTSAEVHYDNAISNFEDVGNNISLLRSRDIKFSFNGIYESGDSLIQGLEAIQKLNEELRKIQFVDAKLSANITEGNSPLSVIFSIADTKDPAGGTINPKNVIWDLGGTNTFSKIKSQLTQDLTNNEIDPGVNVDCNLIDPKDVDAALEEETLGSVYRRCTFKKPGTYMASVIIQSNESSIIAPGVAYVRVIVNPPATKINLKIEGDSFDGPLYVMKYDNNYEYLEIDRDTVTILTKDAEDGITLDASLTQDARFKWDFGNGLITEYQDSGLVTVGGDSGYTLSPGIHEVTLSVINNLGVVDRKIFNIRVAEVVAQIQSKTGNTGFINTPVIFDASQSRTSRGVKIANYAWKIYQLDDKDAPLEELIDPENLIKEQSGPSYRTLEYNFETSGRYGVVLEVISESGEVGTDNFDFNVRSESPQSFYTYKTPDKKQPGTVHFDASASLDPDLSEDQELVYEWMIEPEEASYLALNPDWQSQKKPDIKFLEEGEYDISLTVKTANKEADGQLSEVSGENSTITKTINISSALDIAWDPDQKVTALLNTAEGETQSEEIDFTIISANAVAYEFDFGDGETASGIIEELMEDGVHKAAKVSHAYLEAGTYEVKATVYDEDDNDNFAKKTVFISDGETPLAIMTISINGAEIDLDEYELPIQITRSDNIKFDASRSINTDGSGRKLKYSWDLGDRSKSSEKIENHRYKDLSPEGEEYLIALSVHDKDDPTKENLSSQDLSFKVINEAPYFVNIQGIPQKSDDNLETPLTLTMKVFGAEDPDGEITQYKWWYYPVVDGDHYTDEQLGLKVTTNSTTQLTIGSDGSKEAGIELEYGFGLEVMDERNSKFCNLQTCMSDDAENFNEFHSTITVINGENENPSVSFTVDRTKTNIGEALQFVANAEDPDGNIEQYEWDLNGNGSFSDPSDVVTEESILNYAYEKKNLSGYKVRVRVTDNNGGIAVSNPVTIYIDSPAEPPVAAFTFGFEGGSVRFDASTTEPDEENGAEIADYQWDFDTAIDEDGDGDATNDDQDEIANPLYTYNDAEPHMVKLIVEDNFENVDEVEIEIQIPEEYLLKAAFSHEIENGIVKFINNSRSGIDGEVTEYIWDFDTEFDSDGDGTTDNDRDSTDVSPEKQYLGTGVYPVKLTVKDNLQTSDDVINNVQILAIKPDTGGNLNAGLEGDDSDDPDGTPDNQLYGILLTDPEPDANDIIWLTGDRGSVTFDFSQSRGEISYFTIDKNIYYDTDGNGILDDDEDFKTTFRGKWTTHFEKEWGRTVAKFIAYDVYGNADVLIQEIKFK
jgi:PKD repeat protein